MIEFMTSNIITVILKEGQYNKSLKCLFIAKEELKKKTYTLTIDCTNGASKLESFEFVPVSPRQFGTLLFVQ